jgi:uncharacterized protein
VIAIDTQILVYAHRSDAPWHDVARQRIAELASSGARWAIPLHCLVEFYALVTNPRLFKAPTTSPPDQAIDQIDAWLEAPAASVLGDDAASWPILRDLLGLGRISAGTAHDARIAAVCIQHGVSELWTNDRDFLKFPALRVRNPLIDLAPPRAEESRARYATRRSRR